MKPHLKSAEYVSLLKQRPKNVGNPWRNFRDEFRNTTHISRKMGLAV